MFFIFALFASTLFNAPSVHAQSTFELDPILFSAKASFESLGEETTLPKQTIKIEPSKGSVLKKIGENLNFPQANYGYPSGANGMNMGGRSADDTQISTLGVPLNLPQGGGADLSLYPSFLWVEAAFAPTPIASGYTPTSAAGSIDLKLWTREQIVKRHAPDDPDSRLTFTYDRQIQTYSIATRRKTIAINVGMNLGLQQGPAGSLSYEFLRTTQGQYRFHLLGTDQDGLSPGSKNAPTPLTRKKSWRIVPVLEMQHDLGGDVVLQTTLFTDLSSLVFDDPASTSASRTEQYGIENALLFDRYTIAASIRYEHFRQLAQGSSPEVQAEEFPYLFAATRSWDLGQDREFKTTFQLNGINSLGIAPGARISAKIFADETKTAASFFELNANPKQPTLSSRFYRLPPTYNGNPNLKPERIYSAIAGLERGWRDVILKASIKGEYRTQVQINRNNTTENAGDASLVYLDQKLEWQPFGRLTLTNQNLVTWSRLFDSGLSYPSLPAFSSRSKIAYRFTPVFELEGRAHYQGPSIAPNFTSGGRFHPNYDLYDLEASFTLSSQVKLQAGVENLTNQFAEVVLDYPLPGRLYYVGFQAEL